jgi:glycosyltransferase involved in cell wall biosynthesis
MRKYSVIIPVYNRPEEIKELLESLTHQTYKNFEVLVVEDGSKLKCEDIVNSFKVKLDVQYFFKENSGQGFSRNFGFEKAKGDYFVIFDSDCLIPAHYFQAVEARLNKDYLDAYGGPDASHPSFTTVQKAISYSMTSFYATGGIRGNKKRLGIFHPRSFNMGISRVVYEKVGGFIITRMGEDIEYSIRVIANRFKSGLISDAFVCHKRRTDFIQFFKQLHFFGRARINIYRFFPKELKLVHFFPACFTLFFVFCFLSLLFNNVITDLCWTFLSVYTLLIFIDSLVRNKDLAVALFSVTAVFTQLTGYGVGFMKEGLKELMSPKQQTSNNK